MPKGIMTAEQGEKHALANGTHALLYKVIQQPSCGCKIVGAGNLPSPVRIEFCKAHKAVKIRGKKA